MCTTDFPKVKLPRGSFHGYIKKNKRITHDSFRGKFYESIKSQSGSTNYEKVKCTKQQKSQVVYVRCSSWRQIVRENELKLPKFSRIFGHCCEFFSGFYVNQIQKHLETHANFLQISVQELFSHEVVETILVNPYF